MLIEFFQDLEANIGFENNSAKKLDILHFWQNIANFEYD
ncbi:hypothetical protein AQEC111735_08165 [Aquirufa ecclesiirivi]